VYVGSWDYRSIIWRNTLQLFLSFLYYSFHYFVLSFLVDCNSCGKIESPRVFARGSTMLSSWTMNRYNPGKWFDTFTWWSKVIMNSDHGLLVWIDTITWRSRLLMDYDQHDEADHAILMFENFWYLRFARYRCTHYAALLMPLLTIFFWGTSLACLAVTRQDI
jgi:hypothetical protein